MHFVPSQCIVARRLLHGRCTRSLNTWNPTSVRKKSTSDLQLCPQIVGCCYIGQRAAGTSNLQLSLRLSGTEGAPSASTSVRPRDPGEGPSQRPVLPGRQDSRPLSQVSGAGDDASEADSTTSEATTEVAARQGDTSIPGIDIQV